MSIKRLGLPAAGWWVLATLLGGLAMAGAADAQNAVTTGAEPAAAADQAGDALAEITVTAQKTSESINKVGMSITAATADQLAQRGITDVSQLGKLVPGFTYTLSSYATPIYSLRGIGFQEPTLAASPAVSVYVDEVPLPYPAETVGVALDLDRVEVLKGPQGTLFGENSTGGAVNYIAAKPTATYQAGTDISYGRFNDADASGFISGPITDTLSARLSVRSEQSGPWQRSYTRTDSLGAKDVTQMRLLLDWQAADKLTVGLSLNGWRDRSDSPAGQFGVVHPEVPGAPLPDGLLDYPKPPSDPRAADWNPGQDYRRDNWFTQAAVRADYGMTDNLKLTSITAYEYYHRRQRTDADATTLDSFDVRANSFISTVFQELRLAGQLPGGNWIIGGNYQSDITKDVVQFDDKQSTVFTGLGIFDVRDTTRQNVKTYAAFANAEFEVLDGVKLQGGTRYTKADRSLAACSGDTGNGVLSAFFTGIESLFKGGPVPALPPGACVTLDANYTPGPVSGELDQSNVSWRGGANWQVQPNTLLYANVSKGYKAGSYPTLSANTYIVFRPATQESVIAYETGFKSTVLDNTLHVNGAVFYYDYKDKQIRGKVSSPPFGNLDTLVNIPKSHIEGFELSAVWRPIAALTLTPAVTLVRSRIDGQFFNYTPFDPNLQNFSGEAFPYTPKWQGNLDAEYTWDVRGARELFVGGNFSYQTSTNAAFGQLPELGISAYGLLDLRAGIRASDGRWSLSAYGRNVTDKLYLLNNAYIVDNTYRFAGMPATYGLTFSYRWR